MRPPVFDIVRAEGFELVERGHSWRGLCPLHDLDGRNASFACGDDWYKCFSCGAYGDGPDFIMKLKGMTFPQALAYLGEDRPGTTRQEQAKRTRERTERSAARWNESNLAWTLGKMIRLCHEALRDISPENLDEHAIILQELSILEYQHDLLIYGDPIARAELVSELAELRLLPRRTLFRRDFDFAAWLRGTRMPYGAGSNSIRIREHRCV